MEIFEKLGLGLSSVLFHVINAIILVVALYFLLYKPVKKIVANHKAKLDEVFKENQKLNAEAKEIKVQNDIYIEKVKKDAALANAELSMKAERKSEEIVNEAKQKADNILENAKSEIKAEKLRLNNDIKESAGKLAIDIAEKVLAREVSEEDNKKIIQECLTEWESK